jgi:hypothetical protein
MKFLLINGHVLIRHVQDAAGSRQGRSVSQRRPIAHLSICSCLLKARR